MDQNQKYYKRIDYEKNIITRRLLKDSEDKASKLFEAKFNVMMNYILNLNLIELSQGYDAILTSLTDKMDEETIINYQVVLKLFQILQLVLEI